MQRLSFARRFLTPTLTALAVLLLSRLAALWSVRIEGQTLSHAVAVISAAVQFASVVLPAVILYPTVFFRGAGPAERVIAGSFNLAVWLSIDAYHVKAAFPLLATLYYGAGIGAVLFAWNSALLAGLELICRAVLRLRGEPVRVWTPLPFVPLLVFALVVYLLSLEGGACYFNLFLDGYLALFRT